MRETITEFIRAVGKWWWVVTIDWLIGILLGTSQSFGYANSIPSWAPLVIGGVGFVIACLVAFHRLRVERDEIATQVKTKLPDLRGTIEMIIVGQLTTDGGELLTSCLVKMTIANRNAPSIATSFSLDILMADGKLVVGQLWWDPKSIHLEGDPSSSRGGVDVRPNQLIATVAMSPIAEGGMAFGYLAATFPGYTREDIFKVGNKVIVKFDDINQRRYECIGEMHGENTPGIERTFHPGEFA